MPANANHTLDRSESESAEGRAFPYDTTGPGTCRLSISNGYDGQYEHDGVETGARVRRRSRNSVSRPPWPAPARLWTRTFPSPDRLRNLRHAVAGTGQRDSGLPRTQRRRARGRL